MYQVYQRPYEVKSFCMVKVLTYNNGVLKIGHVIEAFKIRGDRLMWSPVESVVT
jgi:hypothetical protein